MAILVCIFGLLWHVQLITIFIYRPLKSNHLPDPKSDFNPESDPDPDSV